MSLLKPIYLLADSQLLFWRNQHGLFLDSIRASVANGSPTAAYIGASNGDDPNFYSIFRAAMESIGVVDCRMVGASFSTEDAGSIAQADIILLAGGDVEKGWNVFERSGLNELIVKRYFEGALLIGISAGAVQLGLFGWPEGERCENLISTFKLVPFIVGVHEEKEDWRILKQALRLVDPEIHGIGIPTGAGMIYHADRSIEPIRHPLCEFSVRAKKIVRHLLFTSADVDVIEEFAEAPLIA
jgi:peptidase E